MRIRARDLVMPLLGVATVLSAHPHMWIDTDIDFRFSAGGLEGFTVVWTFDELNSAAMIEMYDGDRNGALSRPESETTRVEGFEHLYDIGYFLRLTVNGAEKKPERAKEFLARVERNMLVYSFFVPLRLPVAGAGSTVTLAVMDDTFFVDFAVPESGVTARTPAELESQVRLVRKPQTSSSGWSVMLQQVELRLHKRPA